MRYNKILGQIEKCGTFPVFVILLSTEGSIDHYITQHAWVAGGTTHKDSWTGILCEIFFKNELTSISSFIWTWFPNRNILQYNRNKKQDKGNLRQGWVIGNGCGKAVAACLDFRTRMMAHTAVNKQQSPAVGPLRSVTTSGHAEKTVDFNISHLALVSHGG